MGFFGKSEAELKKIAQDLDERQTKLSNCESELASQQSNFQHEKALLDEAKARFGSERESFREEEMREREAIASENAELERRRQELVKLQAEAKAGFVEQQREAFREAIERRMAELDARQQELNGAEERLAVRYKELHTTEGEVARRELAVTEREQKADAGFADKAKALADETARQHHGNQAEADRLRKLADTLAEDRQRLEVAKAQLVSREQAIIAAEQKRDAGFADERAALNVELRDKRAQSESELAGYREQRFSAIEQEVATLQVRRLEEMEKVENGERARLRGEVAAERDAWDKQREAASKQLEAERAELEKHKGAVYALQSELESLRVELETSERALERKEQRLERQWQKRNEELADEVDARLGEERSSMESDRQSFKDENARLREGLRIQMDLVGAFDQLKQQLGDRDPADVLRELNSKTDELKRLREELATRPTEEIRERYQALESEAKNQKARANELARNIAENSAAVAEVADLRRKTSELSAENKSLGQKATIFEGAANEAQAELERLRAAYERPAEVAARYKEIELPHIKADKVRQPKKDDTIDEITWLTGVGNACDSYGLHFHPRILKAFHTALKTAEWSPITILAGVSGTGKSELPRLYSHFGGLMFEPLSVQPNWDSQESMLGFFNSIDNKFDAQPVLRFLAQSQKKWIDRTNDDDGYPGLQDAVCLILLDEMNLAHPELYFAEFLSKLELRRGMKGTDVPTLPVKIGAGMPAYQLPLGRNVLWTGTMNQDETTKSLSDKVLDRSIIIHFPRPTELKRRLKLSSLDEKNRGPLLHKVLWQSWLAQGSSFSEDDVKPFKCFIQDMNEALANAGRAIGHRVWQSVEYYMANYPDVRAAQAGFIEALSRARKKESDKESDIGKNLASQPVEYYMEKYAEVQAAHEKIDREQLAKALHIAFEDQLVQKVMPKLRGIDTRERSRGRICLDKILDQINHGIGGTRFNLEADFELARDLGYGQFIWQSANYLPEDPSAPQAAPAATNAPAKIVSESAASDNVAAISKPDAPAQKPRVDFTEPPPTFMNGDPDRNVAWDKLTTKQKRIYWSSERNSHPKRPEQ
jgi:chromosome segregation ATPase